MSISRAKGLENTTYSFHSSENMAKQISLNIKCTKFLSGRYNYMYFLSPGRSTV